MTLIRSAHIADPDGFYERLIDAQRDLSDEQADLFQAKLLLILANQVGDAAVLAEAIALARSNTAMVEAAPNSSFPSSSSMA
ncbi:DUF2783 domain-containing protein [Paucibacter sp. AS339]|uniref:DUF2783 domain-containing protein n=1 Tax=Paucibacter hankyongi TaxID=3133434 RepID=UPI0030AC1F69